MTVVLTTHYLDEAERLCDRIGDRPRRPDRRRRHARPRCSPRSATRCSSSASTATAASRARRRCARAGIAGRRRLRHRRHASPSRCTTDRPRRLPRAVDRARARRDRARHAAARPSTTSTCASPATASPPEPPDTDPTHKEHRMTTIDHRPARSTDRRSATTARRAEHGSRAFRTLVRRRLALSARTPREILVPLFTPVLFALVIAPALDSIGAIVPGIDYMSFAAIGTAALLDPDQLHVRRHRRDRRPRERRAAGPARRTDRRLADRRSPTSPSPLAITALQVVVLSRRRSCAAPSCTPRPPASPGSWRRPPLPRRRRCTASPRRWPTSIPTARGVHRRAPAGRDRAVLLRRLALPDHRPARRADGRREGAPAHPRPGADALRPPRPQRAAASTTSGACDTRRAMAALSLARRRRLRRGPHVRWYPCVHSLGRSLTVRRECNRGRAESFTAARCSRRS